MATPPPLFTITFDVKSSDNYGDFITDLRNKLGNPRHFSHNLPVLPPQHEPPTRWFHVKLKTATSTLTLVSRADNLYLKGFQSNDKTLWEFGSDARGAKPTNGWTFLGFKEGYGDLLGSKELTEVDLGPQQMTEAVNVLAGLKLSESKEKAKEPLVVLLLMVHEATRFQTVSKFVAGLVHPRAASKSEKIKSQMKAQIKDWGDLSKAMLQTEALRKKKDKAGKPAPETFTPFPAMGVDTLDDAIATVGILKFSEVDGGMTAATALRLLAGN